MARTIPIVEASSSAYPKGLHLIYAPNGQAGEYAPLAANPYDGCGHACVYCYVPAVRHITREEFDSKANPRKDYLRLLEKDARKLQDWEVTDQVMFSFTTDPYNPIDTSLTRPALELVQQHGMGICTLTKGGLRSIVDIDIFRPSRDAYAATLTGISDEFSAKFEPKAAPIGERMFALRKFHDRGIFTWVSLEPTLSIEQSLAVVWATNKFVDLYKVGRANYMGAITKTTDWRDYTLRMIDVLQQVGAKHYIKKDLQPYLPAGYHNPMRIEQHH